MNERPILFSGPMVRASLDGTKTQTRRVMKPQPVRGEVCGAPGWHWDPNAASHHIWSEGEPMFDADWLPWGLAMCPFGGIGDRLWVREAFTLCESTRADGKPAPLYRATSVVAEGRSVKWKPSIHMPRWASRSTLEITGVRVERLQEISDEDARAEGIERFGRGWRRYGAIVNPSGSNQKVALAGDSFRSLWDSIHDKPGQRARASRGETHPWQANPWVWVIEFVRVQPAAIVRCNLRRPRSPLSKQRNHSLAKLGAN